MQTFVPYADMTASLNCLDNQRLNSQRSEARVILNGLLGKHSGWADHPTMDMWRGHERLLGLYARIADRLWVLRGFKSTYVPIEVEAGLGEPPWWWGYDEVHSSHRQALLTKNPKHYGPLFANNRLHWRGYQYVWPRAQDPGVCKVGEWMP